MANNLKIFLFSAFIIVSLCLFSGCATMSYLDEEPELRADVFVPAWAPSYDDIHLVRYYYMPDIEVYYDVWNKEFVYLRDGDWMFTSSLPPMDVGYDLYNCYVVVLDYRVYEPWMHHHYYVSHYPRYYYNSVYNVDDTRDIRGFIENKESPIRLAPKDKPRPEGDLKNRPENEKKPPVVQEPKKPESTRPPQRMKYYGQDIGKRVNVERQMTKPRGDSRSGR